MILPHSEFFRNRQDLIRTLWQAPTAVAAVRGSVEFEDISGTVNFYRTPLGTLVSAQLSGLPGAEAGCQSPIFAFHIHEGSSCTGDQADPFADAMTHFNPEDCPHPYHAGDLPPLWGSDGYAFSVFLTDRFTVEEIVGKTVIIHRQPDDFTTQPSGNAGQKMACGVIRPYGYLRMSPERKSEK